MRRLACLCIFLLGAGWSSVAGAQPISLTSVPSVHDACGSAGRRLDPRLYRIAVDPGWSFVASAQTSDGGRLLVDTGRNLRALGGRVSVLVSGLEPVGFETDGEAERSLREAAADGAQLRLGFFLGFDDRRRSACLVRSPHAVTTVRAELAFVELVNGSGVLARSETDRLSAWNDDRADVAVPGEGPRGAVGVARFADGQPAPEGWQLALGVPATARRFGECHAAGLRRGAAEEGQVIVRLNVETRSGRIRRADVALSSVSDAVEAACLARALGRHTSLPAGSPTWPDHVDLNVPVRVMGEPSSRPRDARSEPHGPR